MQETFQVIFTMNASSVSGFDYFIYNKDAMFLPVYNDLYGIVGRKAILGNHHNSLGYYQYFRLSRKVIIPTRVSKSFGTDLIRLKA